MKSEEEIRKRIEKINLIMELYDEGGLRIKSSHIGDLVKEKKVLDWVLKNGGLKDPRVKERIQLGGKKTREQEIYELFQKEKRLTKKKIGHVFNVRPENVANIIKILEDDGKIERLYGRGVSRDPIVFGVVEK